MITYRHDGMMPFKVTVKLEGKIVGKIVRPARDAYQYVAKGGQKGEIYDTLEAVKASLEGN